MFRLPLDIDATAIFKNNLIRSASYLWAIQEGGQPAATIYRAIRHNLFPDNFPEQSRFSRICQNLAQSIQRMRYFMTLERCETCSFGLIDSFPCPLCQPVRNFRASLLSDVADIGYNATKQVYYYGVKCSMLVSDTGFPIDYVFTAASVYDSDVALELLQNSSLSLIYGDKGYIDRKVKSTLSQYGIRLISQLRTNMTDYSWFENYKISRLRKPIEMVFSSLEQFGIEHLRCRNLRALKFRVEAILLNYALMLETSQGRFEGYFNYSSAYGLITSTTGF